MAPSTFQPYSIDYYHPKEGGPNELDFLLYAPHGAMPEPFLEEHEALKKASWLDERQLQQICTMEADTGTLDLADAMARDLASRGYRLAVMKTLVPREITDVNRVKEHAVHAIFNHQTETELAEQLLMYHSAVRQAHQDLLAKLVSGGKWLELHSMRSAPTEMDSKPPPTYLDKDGIKAYYKRRIEALLHINGSNARTTCLVRGMKENGQFVKDYPPIVDPVLSDSVEQAFIQAGIEYNDTVYAFKPHVLGAKNPAIYRKNGLVIDVVKPEICGHNGQTPNLLNLVADDEKIERFASVLSGALIQAKSKTENGLPSSAT